MTTPSEDDRVLQFNEGRIKQESDDRVYVECGGDSWHCDFRSLIGELRYARQARSNDRATYAAMAMQGLASNEQWESCHNVHQTAYEAVCYADALLKELAK